MQEKNGVIILSPHGYEANITVTNIQYTEDTLYTFSPCILVKAKPNIFNDVGINAQE